LPASSERVYLAIHRVAATTLGGAAYRTQWVGTGVGRGFASRRPRRSWTVDRGPWTVDRRVCRISNGQKRGRWRYTPCL